MTCDTPDLRPQRRYRTKHKRTPVVIFAERQAVLHRTILCQSAKIAAQAQQIASLKRQIIESAARSRRAAK